MKSDVKIEQLTLIGVGLIGGSFVLDLKRQGLVGRVVGVDVSQENLARALERKVVDEAHCAINAESVTGSEVILIATPVSTLPQICTQLAPLLSSGTIVSDVGSTKQSVLEAFRTYLPVHFPYCVAAHPIAGSDRHGAMAAQFGLYQDKRLVICPHEQQDGRSVQRVEQWWQAVGAKTYQMQAEEHDAIFAAVSHMPHVLAFSYVHQIKDHPDGQEYLGFAASGFRDFTRIASSHPAIWRDICLANRRSLLDLIEGQRRQLATIESMLAAEDSDGLYHYFTEAKRTRDDWLDGQL